MRVASAEILDSVGMQVAREVQVAIRIQRHCDIVVAVPSQPAVDLVINPWTAGPFSVGDTHLPVGVIVGDVLMVSFGKEIKVGKVSGPHPVDGLSVGKFEL